MTALRKCAVAMLFAATLVSHAFAATRVYESGGAGCPLFLGGLQAIGAHLEARGAVVSVGCSFDVAEIASHRGDRIVLIGHSYGALHAAAAARALKAYGIRAAVIAIDPLWTPNVGASCAGVADCACFWGQGEPMPRARNVRIPPARYDIIGHIEYAAQPNVQARVLAAVGR
jgi:pimeloyl-ACP methyl ester carboxylesterase